MPTISQVTGFLRKGNRYHNSWEKTYVEHVPRALYKDNLHKVKGQKKVVYNLMCDQEKIWHNVCNKSILYKIWSKDSILDLHKFILFHLMENIPNFCAINLMAMKLEINFTRMEVPQVDLEEINSKWLERITHVLAEEEAFSRFGIANRIIQEQENKKKKERNKHPKTTPTKKEVLRKKKRTKKKHEPIPSSNSPNKHPKTTPTKKSPKKPTEKKTTNQRLRDLS